MTQTFADPAASIRLAAAPISWGVCEVPGWGRVLEPPKVLGEMAELGLSATELGPPGYLPDDPSALLRQFGLSLVGGFLATPLHVSVDEAVAAAERSAKQLSAGGAEVLVLAAATGLTGYDERPELTDEQWNTLIRSADAVAEVAAGYGLRTVLHPHVGTYVETEPEVERFLRDSSLPLCVDSGHLMIGGTDPVRLVQQHADRVGHVHLKDVRAAVAERVRAGELTYTAAISQGLYAPLGDGDVDIAEMIRVLCSADYRGWYVLEQDTALPEDETGDVDRPKVDTERSMRYLKSIIGTSHR
ncbi:TIM barrel protein [Thermocrispum agreste]|jgi:inosose dehydratase|uniref:Inosose dehydratase n=1 Tax=Thermocrispum agreste TaxID=37925 RepID=A0A2W4KR56_9PSEU|nr:TIM barrel protein [Thermocrispum agreste]PZM90989.1 MAG: inosose dehydratase [Thermocrispum agreste]